MKPETILQSHVLDIIFENRNKAYGAYALRRYYNQRLMQALGGTFLLAGLFIALQSMKPSGNTAGQMFYLDSVTLVAVDIPKTNPLDHKPDEKTRQLQKPKPTIQHVQPVITDKPDDTEVPTLDDLKGRAISKTTNNIVSNGGEPPFDPGEPVGTTHQITDPYPMNDGPLEHADVMPSFNGNIQQFMLRYLRQPDDLDAGEKIVIRIKFVVNEEGYISDIQVIQSGRKDLDEEVIRVIRKMPRWNPGKQGGRAVPVFFNLPVTFVNNGE